jgi:succinylglutamate desuccinylase
MTSLTIKTHVPQGLLGADARSLHEVLDGPTLIELDGERGAPLFVSGLMHGNEDSGLVAIQKMLHRYEGQVPPRPLMILIGNIAAARCGMRRLGGQPDYNRVWPGCLENQASDEARIMEQIHARVIERKAFAAIDIHNNTGRNPHYSVICVQDARVMALARLFAPRSVLFRGLPGTQTASFGDLVPAITIECGQSGDDANAEAAANMIGAVLRLDDLGEAGGFEELALFHTLARVRVRADVALTRDHCAAWFDLDGDLDRHNFEQLEPGFSFGESNHPRPFEVIDEQGEDVFDTFFQINAENIRLRRLVVPAMLTTQARIIRQDCLCYLMETLEV